MITINFIGGAKKSFQTGQLQLDWSDMTVRDLLLELERIKPKDTPQLDSKNSLVAINGVDSSAVDGSDTVIRDCDVISIIPVIHGGASKRFLFESQKKMVQALEIRGGKDIEFLDCLRVRHPKLKMQAISSDFILNRYHLKKIVHLSLESQKNGILLSKKFETDLLMRFAITRQISDAITTAGIRRGRNFILVAVGARTRLDSVYRELSEDAACLFSRDRRNFLKKHFGLHKRHLDSVDSGHPLEDILVEKAAVLCE